ncbi:MAG: hypothetical protein DMG70_28970 [Acidobacteria bacterium]|nr:MAG: hypothetical protein DMG70_28970 [Acidobacteriota bacterium]PYY03728.1 MAG: hypothetical protein DMG69_31965 [Acidobacteriota bacterium]
MAVPNKFKTLLVALWIVLFLGDASHAQNGVLGEVRFVGPSKVEKTSGVWIDGQYVGYLGELKDDKKMLLLPGEHVIAVRQSGYMDFIRNVVVEPNKRLTLTVKMERDLRVQFPNVTSEVKLQVTPDRAAVFLDGGFVGNVHEFTGVGRAMLVSPGKHRIKIALPGYQTFETEITLLPKQKFKIETELAKGSITQADPLMRKE